jgi:hypothetical protein
VTKDIQLALRWAEAYLQAENYIIHSPAAAVREMPWSKVYKFITSKGIVYFKQMHPTFSIEIAILSMLKNVAFKNIPIMIASNDGLHCFLMRDAGDILRDKLKVDYQVDLVIEIFKIYSKIQIDFVQSIPDFFDGQVQDWRLNKLPELYLQLIDSEDILIADGLKQDQIKLLRSFHDQVSKLCEKLSKYPVPETIEHGDFHDNNILILDQHITINDWGDATISHPFFSLASWLNSAARHHGINENDLRYSMLRDAYLENWEQFASKNELLEAFILANKLRPIHFCLNFSRIKSCEGIENFKQYRGYIAEALMEFILIGTKDKYEQ